MARIIWAPSALKDLVRLHKFLAHRNPGAARRASHAIRQGVDTLAMHPEKGRPFEEMPPEFREWFIRFGDSGYVAFYRYDGQLVPILAVRHGREIGLWGL